MTTILNEPSPTAMQPERCLLNPHFGIVVGVDGSPSSAAAVSWAARDAELRSATLTLVHAMRDTVPAWPVAVRTRFGQPPLRRAHRLLGAALTVVDGSCRAGGPAKVITKVAFADPVAALVELSLEAQLVVVGARGGRVTRRAPFGPVSAAVMQRSACAVGVIHDADPLMPRPAAAPVLLAVGDGADPEPAGFLARQEAMYRGVALIEVPAVSTERLVEQSETAQLVVVGDRAGGAAVARSARMPVIVT